MTPPIAARFVALAIEQNEDGKYCMVVELEILGHRRRELIKNKDGTPYIASSPYELHQAAIAARKAYNIPEAT